MSTYRSSSSSGTSRSGRSSSSISVIQLELRNCRFGRTSAYHLTVKLVQAPTAELLEPLLLYATVIGDEDLFLFIILSSSHDNNRHRPPARARRVQGDSTEAAVVVSPRQDHGVCSGCCAFITLCLPGGILSPAIGHPAGSPWS